MTTTPLEREPKALHETSGEPKDAHDALRQLENADNAVRERLTTAVRVTANKLWGDRMLRFRCEIVRVLSRYVGPIPRQWKVNRRPARVSER